MKRLCTDTWTHHIDTLQAGHNVLFSGTFFTARDAAHKRLVKTLEMGEQLPVALADQIVYYTGPCPAPPGWAIGPAGPTTSGRMDVYTPPLLQAGLRGMVGKGRRSPQVIASMVKTGSVYFAATGGAGALLAKRIKKASVVAYEDLGPEAIFRLEVEDFPVIVAIDARGRDRYDDGMKEFATKPTHDNRGEETP